MNQLRLAVLGAGLLLAGVVTGEEATNSAVLEDMVVVTRVEQELRDVPAGVGIVTPAQVEQGMATESAELLRSVPGVDVQGSGYPGTPVKPVMRGQSPGLQSKHVLVLADGRRVAEPFQSAVEFSLLQADDLDHIEVLRGPASALYGSDALGGVINFISRRGTETPVADARAVYGSDDWQQGRVRQGWKVDDFDYFVTASSLQTDGYMKNPDGTDRDWRSRNFTGNFGYAPATNADLRFYTGYYGAEGTDETANREIDKDYQHAAFAWTWDENLGADLLVRAYRNGDDQVYNWTAFPGRGVYDMQTLGTEIQQTIWAGERNRVTGGADFRRDDVDANDVTGPLRVHTRVAGGFVQDEWLATEAITLTAGVRGDHDGDYGDAWSPRAAALWRVDEAAELFAGVGRAHRDPALSDRYFRGEFDGRFFEGNPNLEPETLTAYEVGGRARPTESISIELTAFYDDLEDSFEFSPDADGVFRNRNVASSHAYGVESGVRVALTRTVTTFANYTHTEGEYDDFPTNPEVEGNQLQYLAPDVASAGVEWDGGCVGRHRLAGRYVASRFADDRNSLEGKLDDYTVVDWRSRLAVGEHATVTLSVDNLFDEAYAEFYGIEQPGLTVLGGLEVAL